MFEPQWIIIFLLLGAVVGFIAGLLGVGGGGILVPMLTSMFLVKGIDPNKVVHLALGTSMACIMFTSLSSLRAHNKKASVDWKIVKIMSIGVVMGTFLSTHIASYFDTLMLTLFFSIFMSYTAINILTSKTKPTPTGQLTLKNMLSSGLGIGAISALVSIGGGALTVPYLLKKDIELKKAIGISAALGFPIAIAGTLGYLINGLQSGKIALHSYGYIYFPAVIYISLASYFVAPLGVKAAHYLPVVALKRLFALLLILLSLKMLFLSIY